MAATAIIGVDAGGTKCQSALVRSDGRLLAAARGVGANYQAVGREAATSAYLAVVAPLIDAAEREGVTIVGSAWGIAGLDRPRDEEILVALIDHVDPAPIEARLLVNDAYLILRAGSPTGQGVAVASGTGSNCVGVGPDGVSRRIGGLAFEFGDAASGGDIGRDGLRAAFRGEDGRGPKTLMSEMLRDRFNLQRLDDLVDFFVADADVTADTSVLAPLVFDAATLGDLPALSILEEAGRELALCARILARQMFSASQAFPLVLGGSVLQSGRCGAMRDALVASVAEEFAAVSPVVLEPAPILGAALLALDRLPLSAASAYTAPTPSALAALGEALTD